VSLELLDQMLEPLPYALRDQITGYANAIDESGEDIFATAQVPFDRTLLDRVVFLAGVCRLWTLVDWQFSILSNSLSILSSSQVEGFAIGRRRLDRQSQEFVDLDRMRTELLRRIRDLDCERYVALRSVQEILLLLREEASGHQ
jgi:hypothetical protein